MDVQRRICKADHGVGAVFEVFLRIFVVGVGNFDRLSNHVFRKATGIYKALTAVFRHTSGSEHGLVDVICQHMCTVNALFVVVLPDEIGIHTACGGNHTVGFLHGGNVGRIKADGGDEAKIVEFRIFHIGGLGGGHDGTGISQTREKRHTQHNDEQDSDIPPKAARNAAPRVFSECFCHAFSGSLRVTIQSVPRA